MGLVKLEDGRLGITKKLSVPEGERTHGFLPATHSGRYCDWNLVPYSSAHVVEIQEQDLIKEFLNTKYENARRRSQNLVKVCFIGYDIVVLTLQNLATDTLLYCPILVKDILETGATGTYMFLSFDEALIGALVFKHQGYNSKLEEYIPKMLFEGTK